MPKLTGRVGRVINIFGGVIGIALLCPYVQEIIGFGKTNFL